MGRVLARTSSYSNPLKHQSSSGQLGSDFGGLFNSQKEFCFWWPRKICQVLLGSSGRWIRGLLTTVQVKLTYPSSIKKRTLVKLFT